MIERDGERRREREPYMHVHAHTAERNRKRQRDTHTVNKKLTLAIYKFIVMVPEEGINTYGSKHTNDNEMDACMLYRGFVFAQKSKGKPERGRRKIKTDKPKRYEPTK